MRARLALAALALLTLSACREDLYTNLDEREANRIVAVLERSGIPANRLMQDDGAMTVRVDEARFAEAVALLEQAGLPQQKFASMGEVFQQDGLVASPMQERARMLFALSEELSRTVSEIDGIQAARVHIVLPENDPLRQGAQPSSASVFVRHDAGLDVATLIPQIKTLIANGIAGLTYDKVSVVPVVAAARLDPTVQPLANVLGIWVLETSRARLVALLTALAGLSAVLGAALGWMVWRKRGQAETYLLEVRK
ncbi:type III secretion system inner membrane ring lipoprotein SctJ [Falsirhodobacter xinxiangensis]|uniref:type III secretion system inner membrane ring lipoprotein SctJ n=1 Tax=Falsirhodobacter xinxiangensis TaxID=2530049 RepID=UPI0010AA0FAF|nr:type III secretion inner membrane ring lipoprotein SctJ [Rhodobacter xinxiangensis]